MIYNRNGNLVYETTNYQNNWNGTRNDRNMPATTYYYVLEFEGAGVFKGDLTIIREKR